MNVLVLSQHGLSQHGLSQHGLSQHGLSQHGGWLLLGHLGQVPVQPDRGQARSWAVQELSRPEYQQARPGVVERALSWLVQRLDVLSLGTGAPPALALLGIALLVGGVCGYVIYRAGGLHPAARRRTQVLPATPTTAAGHRAAAAAHAAAGHWDLAVVERFRAIARELEERALLRPQPGRTAVELARDGGRALPNLAADLLVAARYFDDVSYGHLAVGQRAEIALRELDRQLQAAGQPHPEGQLRAARRQVAAP
jgi:hypothetical protein